MQFNMIQSLIFVTLAVFAIATPTPAPVAGPSEDRVEHENGVSGLGSPSFTSFFSDFLLIPNGGPPKPFYYVRMNFFEI
ncbi:hypothetical protein K435DRAFT_865028 [Dendrothele bispora CBS 962.96]|uniref:Uncharacterized protein n=1 Tax=Dendrothele bispora (strain CBS 962.96) TaxID=1314807 RepID=A0A4S8LLV8_DENBC|nr:hypothetical protein K435DRAFT_865028 [Dendrothele bispora CBS 962.96]